MHLPALAPGADITGRLEAARRIEQQLLAALGTAHQPDAEVVVSAQNSGLWGEQELRKVDTARTLLTALVQESKVKLPAAPGTTPPADLGAAIEELNQAEATVRQRAILQQTEAAKEQANATVAEAEGNRILTEARLQASNILAAAHADKVRQEQQARVQQAEQQVEESKSKVAAETKLDEARRIELRKKATDPDIQAKLAPFLTPGYWQLNASGGSIGFERKPHSWTQMQSLGALAETVGGLQKLADIATTTRDKVRPRWKLPSYWVKNPTAMEKVKESQALLNELGPVLVEMKMLDP